VRCELTATHLHAYLDGELDAAGAASFERHLHTCSECAAALRVEESLRRALSGAQLYERAPESLRKKMLAELPSRSSEKTADGLSPWFRWTALAAVVLLAGFFGKEVLRTIQTRTGAATMASAVVDAHLRSLQPGHLFDVPSSDQHTVKPWFDGKIDFAPTVRDFTDGGFPLLGGRLDVIDGQTAAALVYGRRKHIINVFLLESPGTAAISGSGEQHGYKWVAWQKDGFTYVAVSDTSASDLEQLRDLFLK
jgi:mycothiol system anti-sigma-R factor